MTEWPLVMLGGAVGALLRFEIGRQVAKKWRKAFPLGTFLINLVGSFCLGLVFAYTHQQAPAWVYPLLGTGLLGGFTTFSTFGVETVQLMQKQRQALALLYVIASALLGLLGAWLGYTCYTTL
ncbi:MAG TPA: fluoride efflux transporter CrcB [Bacilli bacterium]|nr:fluoride efflux transporter CrcB [Bacilli bacterium]